MASRRVSIAASRQVRSVFHQRRHISAYGYEQAKALTISQYGEPSDVLSLHTHSISPAHSDKLTIRFLATPINPADINQIQGVYPSKPTFTTSLGTSEPIAVAGNEGVAEIISVGSGVKNYTKGDWAIMKAPGFGTWRTHAQTTEDNLIKIEDKTGITPLQAGTISINPCTAYCMLKNFIFLQPGDWFIQNGANSGVGRAAIQFGRISQYRSINVIRDRPEGVEGLKKELADLGATVVVTESELKAPEFRERIAELTRGGREQIRLGLNCVGGKPAIDMAKLLAPDSHLVTYGAMSKQPLSIPAGMLIFKNINFNGFWVSKWGADNPEEKKKTITHVLDLIRSGEFKDTPMEEVKWDWDTKKEPLVEAVQGTLEGYRKAKQIFVFGNT